MATLNITGKDFGNLDRLMSKIKEAIDPNDVANPGRYIDMAKLKKASSGMVK
jgi:hypothetical protein